MAPTRTGKLAVPPPNLPLPVRWDDEETVRGRLREGITDILFARRKCQFRYPFPPAEVVETFLKYYGPTQCAFDALDAEGRVALREYLTRLWAEHNQVVDSITHIKGEYLEVVATRT